MTNVSYEVKDSTGNVTRVDTLKEAKSIVAENGGNYKVVYDEAISQAEAFCKAYTRRGGKQNSR